MNKPDLALNNLEWLIFHKTKPILNSKTNEEENDFLNISF